MYLLISRPFSIPILLLLIRISQETGQLFSLPPSSSDCDCVPSLTGIALYAVVPAGHDHHDFSSTWEILRPVTVLIAKWMCKCPTTPTSTSQSLSPDG